MSSSAGTGKVPSPARAGRVRVWTRVQRSFSSTGKGLACGRGSLCSPSLYLLSGACLRWSGRDGSGETAARAAGTWDLSAKARPAGVRGCGPARGQGCALAVRPHTPFPPRPGAQVRTEDRLGGDPDSQLSNRLLWPEGAWGGHWRNRGACRAANVTQLAFPGPLPHTVFTLLTFGARRNEQEKKVRNVVQVSLG